MNNHKKNIDFSEKNKVSIILSSKEKDHADAWKLKALESIKRKIKLKKLYRQGYMCCYCGNDLFRVHFMSIDIEHILPKSEFRKYMFTSKNLSASCKQCNMTLKNKDTSFIIKTKLFERKPF